jgi:thiamine transporter ThiT
MTSEQLDQMVEMQKKFSWVTYPAILIMSLLLGLVVGLVTGLIVKKSKPEY